MKKPNIVVIGGGTGTFVTLSGLKKYPVDLSAIVTMMDDGGSSGKLRDQLGVLPPGDLRQCLVALSDASDVWRKLFTYRFESGDLDGHNFGNILLSALEKVSDNYQDALDEAHRVMDVQGRVIPVTYNTATIHVEYESGRMLVGEKLLDENSADGSTIKNAFLQPSAQITDDAAEAIANADYIIAGPGDLYSSIIAVALVDGVKDAIKQSKAQIVYIMNLMTKSSQTPSYTACQHVADLSKYFGRDPNFVVVNTGNISEDLIKLYAESNDVPVYDDLDSCIKENVIRADIISDVAHSAKSGKHAQTLAHSIVRHDSDKLANIIMESILRV
jgi:uncharacterized cofD-like protein